MPNVPLAEPPWSQQAERLDNPQFFRWGAPIAPPLAHMPNPQPLAIMPPPAAGPRDWHQDQGDAFPEAVPHNMDKWPWNMDNNNLPVAPDVARLKFAMRRPPKQRQKQDHRTGLPRYHSLMLAPRPPDWRPDFPMRSTGLFRRLSRIRGERSQHILSFVFSPTYHDRTKICACCSLHAQSSSPLYRSRYVSYLLRPPAGARSHRHHLHESRPTRQQPRLLPTRHKFPRGRALPLAPALSMVHPHPSITVQRHYYTGRAVPDV